jgi:chromosome segregation ATPase
MSNPSGWPWRLNPATHHLYAPEFPYCFENLQGRDIARFRYEGDAQDILDALARIKELEAEVLDLKEIILDLEEISSDHEHEAREYQAMVDGLAEDLDDYKDKVSALEMDITELREDSGL